MRRIAVIMAGGAGERFWPLSRLARPKQLLKLTHPDRTLLEESVQRIDPLVGLENIFIATSRGLVGAIREARTGVPDANVIGEPDRRNTAGALAYAAAAIRARFGTEPVSMAILTADHRIEPAEAFRATVTAALETVEREPALGTIGIPPTRPETGYGYIEVETADSAAADAVLPVVSFREKPDRPTAEEFVRSGRFFWNSGMFFWRLEVFIDEMRKASPAHGEAIDAIAAALAAGNQDAADAAFRALPNISIDYALMEKAGQVVMAVAGFEWDDVGAWDALDRGWAKDAHGNVAVGDPVLIDTADCIIYNDPGAAKMAVAAIGVRDLAVIVSADGIVIVPKDRVQDVKQAVAALKAQNRPMI